MTTLQSVVVVTFAAVVEAVDSIALEAEAAAEDNSYKAAGC